jgi:hypothetical protein
MTPSDDRALIASWTARSDKQVSSIKRPTEGQRRSGKASPAHPCGTRRARGMGGHRDRPCLEGLVRWEGGLATRHPGPGTIEGAMGEAMALSPAVLGANSVRVDQPDAAGLGVAEEEE